MSLLKLLGPQKRVDQVEEQSRGGESGDDVVHENLLELVARLREDPASKQEQTADGEIDDVEHV
jgi:hypothetical protein